MKTLTCACLPNRESGVIIERISKNISTQCKSKNALTFQPHFTIRGDFKIQNHDIKHLKNDFQNYCKNINPIRIHLTKYGFYPWKIIFLDIDRSLELQALHNKSMELIEKYRTPWIPEIYINNNNFKGKQKNYSLKYGYHFCYEYFSPHFTIAGNDMAEERFQNMKNKLANVQEDIDVVVKELAFFNKEDGNKIFMKIVLGKS